MIKKIQEQGVVEAGDKIKMMKKKKNIFVIIFHILASVIIPSLGFSQWSYVAG